MNMQYLSLRARIALRLVSTLPLDDTEKSNVVQKEIGAIAKGKGRPLSEQNVVAAFSNGDEGIDVIRMICIDYADDIKARLDQPTVEAARVGDPEDLGDTSEVEVPAPVDLPSANGSAKYTRPKRNRKHTRKLLESMNGNSGSSDLTNDSEEWGMDV